MQRPEQTKSLTASHQIDVYLARGINAWIRLEAAELQETPVPVDYHKIFAMKRDADKN